MDIHSRTKLGATPRLRGVEQQQFALDSTTERWNKPAGLTFRSTFIDRDAETKLLAEIDTRTWSTAMSRRVQHYGWEYDYRARTIRPESYLGPLPQFLQELAGRVGASAGFIPDQAIINEYTPGQGIAAHVDCEPCFGDTVAMVGLGADIAMDFAHKNSDRVWNFRFARCGLLVIAGEARYDWTHSIARRMSDRQFGIRRQRRVSVTFRSVVAEYT